MKKTVVDYTPESKAVIEALFRLRTKREYAALCRSIEQKTRWLAQNPLCGTKIPQELIPKEYRKKHSIDNLWKVDLPDYWRMLYTLKHGKVEIIALVLDILDHPSYDEKFGYRKK
jgi:plasmid stabilization system protein ParE